jgi:ABC-2 type transport system ATP-binding protein
MEEADALSHRILILDHGRVVVQDTPGALKDVLGGDVIELGIRGNPAAFAEAIRQIDWIKNVTIDQETVRLTMEKAEERVANVILAAAEKGLSIRSVNIRRPSLDDVFIHYTGKTIRDTGGQTHVSVRTRHMHHRR